MTASLSRLRNIGIIAHIDAGKTTLSERILYYTDTIHRMGEVHEGAAAMDFMPEEQERGITIVSSCGTCEWGNARINLIDTPGHVDFTIEVERSLRVLDGAVGVFCAVGGVEPQSETVWRQSEKFGIPKLAFINKMDRPGADFAAVLEAMRRRLGANPVAVTIPLGAEEEFRGVIDLAAMERLTFAEDDKGRTYSREPLTAEEAALAAPWREKLLETAADMDDALLQAYLGGEDIAAEDIHNALRAATLARVAVPVFVGAALRNIGVQPLLDAVVAYLPGPLDAAKTAGVNVRTGEPVEITPDPDAPLVALVFKVTVENARKIALTRIYSGAMREGEACRNVTSGSGNEHEKIGRMFRVQAGRREPLESAFAGDIVAVQGMRTVRTGDSLASDAMPILLENIEAYTPVISLAVEPKNTEEGKKLDDALTRFCVEDPTVRVSLNEDSGQRLISGMGELHLEVLLERLKRENGLAPRAGNPQVLYHETARGAGTAEGEFDRELGGQRHYGCVSVTVTPRARGAGNEVTVPKPAPAESRLRQLYEALEQGLRDALQCGPLGYGVEDVAVDAALCFGKEEGMTAPGCRMAAAQAVKAALAESSPALLEPIMAVEISVPEPLVGAAISLLNTRGGKVETIDEDAGQRIVRAYAPMRELFGFSTALRSATQGRAGMVMRFARLDLA
ncbi:MAG: Elongation factor G [Desulfovibrio sp.]